ncbi:hypothetical protein SDC9_76089 [bioreactor metagenome]|uniref:Uncharacterized protein n=1 Tax=bioreactor metagenome TaxID=1076179 RepID=A0A644YML1_9ZZZZ
MGARGRSISLFKIMDSITLYNGHYRNIVSMDTQIMVRHSFDNFNVIYVAGSLTV